MAQRVMAQWDTMTTTIGMGDDNDDNDGNGAAGDKVDNDGNNDDYGNGRQQ